MAEIMLAIGAIITLATVAFDDMFGLGDGLPVFGLLLVTTSGVSMASRQPLLSPAPIAAGVAVAIATFAVSYWLKKSAASSFVPDPIQVGDTGQIIQSYMRNGSVEAEVSIPREEGYSLNATATIEGAENTLPYKTPIEVVRMNGVRPVVRVIGDEN